MSEEQPPLDPLADAPQGTPTPRERQRYIARLQASARWETGITGPELAERWSLDESTIRHDAAAASARVTDELGDVSAVRVLAVGLAHEAIRMARRAADPEKGAAVLIKAADLIVRVTGAAPAQRHAVAFVEGEGDFGFIKEPPAEGEKGDE